MQAKLKEGRSLLKAQKIKKRKKTAWIKIRETDTHAYIKLQIDEHDDDDDYDCCKKEEWKTQQIFKNIMFEYHFLDFKRHLRSKDEPSGVSKKFVYVLVYSVFQVCSWVHFSSISSFTRYSTWFSIHITANNSSGMRMTYHWYFHSYRNVTHTQWKLISCLPASQFSITKCCVCTRTSAWFLFDVLSPRIFCLLFHLWPSIKAKCWLYLLYNVTRCCRRTKEL